MISIDSFKVRIFACALASASCGKMKKEEPSQEAATEQQPNPETNQISISGTLKFLVSDTEKGIEQNAVVPEATVFVKGFPDQAVTTDIQGAFTLAIKLPEGATLSPESADYEVIGWTIINDVKFGGQKKAENVSAGEPYALGDIMIGYTQKLKFFPQARDEAGNLKAIDHRLCRIVLPGYEGKSNVMTPDTADGDIAVDYLPPATYQFRATCEGYEVYDGEFSVEFDQTSEAVWVSIPPFEMKAKP